MLSKYQKKACDKCLKGCGYCELRLAHVEERYPFLQAINPEGLVEKIPLDISKKK